MVVNQKAVKVINKIFEAGITEAEIGMINDLQKAIKANKVITFLGGGAV